MRIGAAGLGRAFALMAPTLAGDMRVKLVAAADPRAEACAQFSKDFGGRAYATVQELCAESIEPSSTCAQLQAACILTTAVRQFGCGAQAGGSKGRISLLGPIHTQTKPPPSAVG